MRRILILFLLLLLTPAAGIMQTAEQLHISSVSLHSHVENRGQILDTMTLMLDEPASAEHLSASDFDLYAEIRWTDRSFHAVPSELRYTPQGLVLCFAGMPETWNETAWWRVACSDARFSFSKTDITEDSVDVADDFRRFGPYKEDWSPTGETFDYSLFTPKVSGEPLPLVLVLHGSGDFDILRSGRQALCFAEPEFQQKHPCYVLVPYFQEATLLSNDEVLSAAKAKISSMVKEGLLDPSRIYVTGLSMGGWNAFRLLTRCSEKPFFAAGILLCPWLYRTLTTQEIERAVDTPLWVLYGERDTVVPNPGEIADRLASMGSSLCKRTVYRTEEFEAEGISSQHAVDLLALRDDSLREWLLAQHLDLK
ncbi:MAG: dienelactone hydrolase family protein [Clostridia bacterium]|nr:dienelactone hydrolase family protein [Clostridia bacterium]